MNVLKRDCHGEVMFDAAEGYTGGADLQSLRAMLNMLAAQNRAAGDAIRRLIETSPCMSSDDYAALVAPEFHEIERRLKAVEGYAVRAQNAHAAERGRESERAGGAGTAEPLFAGADVDVEGYGD